jgi:hypothetical protein
MHIDMNGKVIPAEAQQGWQQARDLLRLSGAEAPDQLSQRARALMYRLAVLLVALEIQSELA